MPFFIFGTANVGFCQENLVRNPSFENYNHLPAYIGDAPGSITDWNFANDNGSGDYFHEKAIGIKCRTIDNYFGSEKPHSGIAYAGFCITPLYREVLCSQLIKSLEKGKKYKFTMFVSKGDNEEVSYLKEINVMFLSREWPIQHGIQMGLPPQIVFYSDSGFTQTNGWQELTMIYTARGNEKWIYIGSLDWKCDTCKSIPGKARTENPGTFGGVQKQEAHYYVDDVSIVEVFDTPQTDTTQLQTGIVYAFNNIHFATNSAVLEKVDQPDLEKILAYLKSNADVSVTVSGHTDSIGTLENNRNLSVARADAVKKYFMDQGIASGRIRTEGFGETKPVAPNKTEQGRALNRRVEFLFESTADH